MPPSSPSRALRHPLAKLLLGALLSASLAAQIRRIETFRDGAADPDWSPVTNRIAFERAGKIFATTYYAASDQCLACTPPGRCLTPVWYPSGNFLAFHCGDWMRLDLSAKRTDPLAGLTSSAVDLRFSRNGDRAAWLDRGRVTLARVKADQLIAPSSLNLPCAIQQIDDFTADSRALLVTASVPGPPGATAIEQCDLPRGPCRLIAGRPLSHNDFARLTPSGKRLVFASTQYGWLAPNFIDYKSDLWLATPAGNQQRMTYLNEPADPQYVYLGARLLRGAWSPDGIRYLVTILDDGRAGKRRLAAIEFPEIE